MHPLCETSTDQSRRGTGRHSTAQAITQKRRQYRLSKTQQTTSHHDKAGGDARKESRCMTERKHRETHSGGEKAKRL